MARQPRYHLPGQPQHVVQRGTNQTAIFDDVADYAFFLECLRSASGEHHCAIHAYVLMTNHVHVLATTHGASGISLMMQSIGRRYVRYYNDRHQRSGSLWQGRYRATVVDSDEYLFACYRYIEDNPVRAGMVRLASHYRWSSHGSNALGIDDPIVTPHQRYVDLGSTPDLRRAAYRAILAQPGNENVQDGIRMSTRHAWALGSDRFKREIAGLGRRPTPLPTGRHRKPEMGV